MSTTAPPPPLPSDDRATSWMWPGDACSSPALLRWVVEDAAKHVPLPASWWERTICIAAVYSGNADTTLKAARQLGFKLHSNTWMMAAGLGRIDMLDLIESDCGLWEEGEPLPSRHFILRESYKDGCRPMGSWKLLFG